MGANRTCAGLPQTSTQQLVSAMICNMSDKRPDTVGEITTRRQKPLVLRIMVGQGRTMILFLSGLTPRCEQIFPHGCCFQPVRRFRQQMSHAPARTIMERKRDGVSPAWDRAANPISAAVSDPKWDSCT